MVVGSATLRAPFYLVLYVNQNSTQNGAEADRALPNDGCIYIFLLFCFSFCYVSKVKILNKLLN